MINNHFENIPIEFKEINVSDFDINYYNIEDKVIIEPNNDGYISNTLLPILENDYENKNTTVINAGVGQGKSRAILKMVEKYLTDDRFLIIIAVPYKNLIEQYVSDCRVFAKEKDIASIIDLDIKIQEKKYRNKISPIFTLNEEDLVDDLSIQKINIVTVNSLLGNSGDTFLFQSKDRAKYFNKIQQYCKDSNKKLVVFYDEIHDSIHNFKEELMYKLWSYQGLIHKNYIISATFNEASKEVIKYLSELTNKNIFIIESKRKRIKNKQSNLFLKFYSGYKIQKDEKLIELIESLLKKSKPFDILVYSKQLIKTFLEKPKIKEKKDTSYHEKEMKDVLYPYEKQINRCYNDVFDYKNKDKLNKKYNPSMINIGTNFSTGINIEKENHTYIIILPKRINIDFFDNKGIFSNGANTIIQALARQRKKGDIYMFMPSPPNIKKETLPYSKSHNQLIYDYIKNNLYKNKEEVSYASTNEQNKELSKVYNSLVRNVKTSTDNIARYDRDGMNRILFPPKEIFILTKGENYLNQTFFNGNLSAFVTWSAICNQFLNCNLVSIETSLKFYFKSKTLFDDFYNIYTQEKEQLSSFEIEHNLESLLNSLSKKELYEYFRNLFFENNNIYIDDILASKDHMKILHLYLLSIIMGISIEDYNVISKEERLDIYHTYLKSNTYYSSIFNEEKPLDFVSKKDLKRIEYFENWFELFQILEKHKEKSKLPNTPPLEFEEKCLNIDFKEILQYDYLLNDNIFPLKHSLKKSDNVKYIYKVFIKVFYDGKLKLTTYKKKKQRMYFLKEPFFENLTNFIYKPKPDEIL